MVTMFSVFLRRLTYPICMASGGVGVDEGRTFSRTWFITKCMMICPMSLMATNRGICNMLKKGKSRTNVLLLQLASTRKLSSWMVAGLWRIMSSANSLELNRVILILTPEPEMDIHCPSPADDTKQLNNFGR